MSRKVHSELHELKSRLQQIYDRISDFQPLTEKPPILDSFIESSAVARDNDDPDDGNWLQQEPVPGLKKLKENIKLDLGVLEKFLEDPESEHLPPLSTNAPYLIAVWNEALSAPPPIVSIFKTYQSPDHPQPTSRSGKAKQGSPGVKVDVVADNGRRWIRVNTIKNSRLLAELREIDSYLTDDDDDDFDVGRPTLAQTEFDNSILRMGRALVQAAKVNVIPGTDEIPQVTLRLTRLDPRTSEANRAELDPRLEQTISVLEGMGICAELGERNVEELLQFSTTSAAPQISSSILHPTANINLDLSMLIALVSDLTHASLPSSIEDAKKRFIPPQEYREWKQKRQESTGKPPRKSRHQPPQNIPPGQEMTIDELPYDLIKHSRALTNQLLQEMGHSMMQEIGERIQVSLSRIAEQTGSKPNVVFWTTAEAKERCLRIVSKIGGIHEKRRARALFCLSNFDAPSDQDSNEISLKEAQQLYWKESRFPLNFISLQPIQIYPAQSHTALDPSSPLQEFTQTPKPLFFRNLDRTCTHILSQDSMPHPRALAKLLRQQAASGDLNAKNEDILHDEIQRASVTKANPRLTAHTVQTLQWGAQLGWTTLTANRSSIKAVVREMKNHRISGHFSVEDKGLVTSQASPEITRMDDSTLAIWIMSPRSLAEGMTSQN